MTKLIRKSTINISYSNTGKLNKINEFLKKYTICTNQFIDILWEIERFKGVFVERIILDRVSTTLTFRAKQSCAQTALHIVKSQKRKKIKVKPIFKGTSFELDQRFIQIYQDLNSFDIWIKLKGQGTRKQVLLLPSKKHKQFYKFSKNEWELKQCGRFRVRDNKILVDLYFTKDKPMPKTNGEIIGLDCGYKKLAVLSTGQRIGVELTKYIDKISSKLQGSKAFKRALVERNEYINREIKNISLFNIKIVVVEALKHVKHKTKGKIRKEFMNKLQRWVYRYFMYRLRQTLEVVGVQYQEVNPNYTSRICPNCSYNHKDNRCGEIFKCTRCGYTEDADFNASLNIRNRFILQELGTDYSTNSDPVQEVMCGALSSA